MISKCFTTKQYVCNAIKKLFKTILWSVCMECIDY